MSNAKSQKPSLATQLRTAKREAKQQIEDLQSRLETTNSQLETKSNLINRLDTEVDILNGRVRGLAADLSDASRDFIRLKAEAEHIIRTQDAKSKVILGLIEKVATEQITKNDIIVFFTYLGTAVPDAVLNAAEKAFKPLLEKLKAEHEAQQREQAFATAGYASSDCDCEECSTARSSSASPAFSRSGVVVGDPIRLKAIIESLDDETGSRVVGLLHNGQKIYAIKVVREATGCSLLDAKNAVESIQNGLGMMQEIRRQAGL